MTAVTPSDPTRSMRPTRSERGGHAESALSARDRSVRPAARERARAQHRIGWILLLVLPGVWVVAVLGLGLALHMELPLAPLLAAAPAIACAGTGRKLCVTLGCLCALIALTPFDGQPVALGQRIGTASAVLAVSFTSYFVVRRRIRMQRAYDEIRRIAEVTQRVLLRPIPERIGPIATAVEYLSAATGAHVGGDFYEVIDTPYGVRAILGDMRGNGLDAVSGAAALLGAFREAGAVEPTLEAVAARLDAALSRHAAWSRRAELVVGRRDEFHGGGARAQDVAAQEVAVQDGVWESGVWESGVREAAVREVGVLAQEEAQLWAEDFATAVLVQVPYGRMRYGGDGAAINGEPVKGDAARLVVCGHPAPYLIRGGEALAVVPERATLPLGLGSLIDEPYTASASVVPFEPGDALVFYTDGVSDARSRSGEFFRLEELLGGLGRFDGHGGHDGGGRDGNGIGRDGVGGRTPRSVAATVRSRLLEHMRHELNDDAALLVLGRLGVDG